MQYATAPGGKLLRPLLVFAAARAASPGTSAPMVERCAAAIELVHVHSLLHDDLPCMDDDGWRRGRPSLHVAFDEATAILAGDALLVLAFELLTHDDLAADRSARATHVLARALGGGGVSAGQMLDLYWHEDPPRAVSARNVGPLESRGLAKTKRHVDSAEVQRVHQLKTAALMMAACHLGAIAVGAPSPTADQLCRFGRQMGLAFQGLDDLIDEVGDQAKAGKTLRKDRGQQRPGLPAAVGLQPAFDVVTRLIQSAHECLDALHAGADELRDILRMLERKLESVRSASGVGESSVGGSSGIARS
jgi:farnesyl diphosphate synthase